MPASSAIRSSLLFVSCRFAMSTSHSLSMLPMASILPFPKYTFHDMMRSFVGVSPELPPVVLEPVSAVVVTSPSCVVVSLIPPPIVVPGASVVVIPPIPASSHCFASRSDVVDEARQAPIVVDQPVCPRRQPHSSVGVRHCPEKHRKDQPQRNWYGPHFWKPGQQPRFRLGQFGSSLSSAQSAASASILPARRTPCSKVNPLFAPVAVPWSTAQLPSSPWHSGALWPSTQRSRFVRTKDRIITRM
mmetsp:Transcript_79855/g.191724  ORF Transcript_79855/g.191724 Transcript_79855/m.191724 type:complete len:245 (-) Transcript_79855:61-795(-)